MKLSFFMFLCALLSSTTLASQTHLEWFHWGPSNAYHVKAQRLESDSSTLEGQYMAYYQDLTIAKGNFEGGKKVGAWKYFNLQGTIISEGEYQNGVKHGPWLYYFDNKQLKAHTFWENGAKTGNWKSYFRSGVRYSEVSYSDNLPSKIVAFYHTGDSALIRTFQADGTLIKGKHRSYHFQAQVYEDYQFTMQKNDSVLSGQNEFFLPENYSNYFDARIKDQISPKTSFTLDGHYRKYHPTGPLWVHQVYDNGKLLNAIPAFDKWGNIVSHGDFKNGTGTLITQHSIGDTAVIQEFENGYPNGSFYRYEEGNRLRQKGKFCEGKPCGSWITYNVNLKPEYHYKFDGAQSYHRESRAGNNRLTKSEFFVNGWLEGPVLSYDQYGDTLSYVNYKNGKASGAQRYYVNGNLKTSGSAYEDILVGEWTTLNPSGRVTFREKFQHQGYWNPKFEKQKNQIQLLEPEASDFSYDILQAQAPEAFLEDQTVQVNGELYAIKLVQDNMEGDVIFSFELESTGHVRSIECVKHSGAPYYQASLTLLEGLLFAQPIQAFGFPKDSSFLISLYFEPI